MYISGSLTPELVVPIHRNGGSQTPDRWCKVVRNIHSDVKGKGEFA